MRPVALCYRPHPASAVLGQCGLAGPLRRKLGASTDQDCPQRVVDAAAPPGRRPDGRLGRPPPAPPAGLAVRAPGTGWRGAGLCAPGRRSVQEGMAIRGTELYRQLSGTEAPWQVQPLELPVADQEVDVVAGHARGCPLALPGAQARAGRLWSRRGEGLAAPGPVRAHDLAEGPSAPGGRPARGVRQVALPWAEPHRRSRLLPERLALDVLGERGI